MQTIKLSAKVQNWVGTIEADRCSITFGHDDGSVMCTVRIKRCGTEHLGFGPNPETALVDAISKANTHYRSARARMPIAIERAAILLLKERVR